MQARYRCPECKTRFAERGPAFPFCSDRCRLIDLDRWLGGEYAIPTSAEEAEDGSEQPLEHHEPPFPPDPYT